MTSTVAVALQIACESEQAGVHALACERDRTRRSALKARNNMQGTRQSSMLLSWATGPGVLSHMGALTVGPAREQYECGKVCLSLLNTWAGRNGEVWDPTSSTILQARPTA